MARDRKYGAVTTEFGDFPHQDEPVVLFRAKDKLLIPTLQIYSVLCTVDGSPQKHIDLITATIDDVGYWQRAWPGQTPQSKDYPYG